MRKYFIFLLMIHLLLCLPLMAQFHNLQSNFSETSSSFTGRDSILSLINRWAEGPCYTVAASGDYVFYNNGAYLDIVDISSLDAPHRVNRLLLDFIPADLVCLNGLVYVRDYNGKILSINIESPENARIVQNLTLSGGPVFDWKFWKDTVYVAQNRGIKILAISPDGRLKQVENHSDLFEEFVRTLEIKDSLLFAFTGNRLFLLNLKNPSELRVSVQMPVSDYVNSIIVNDETLYLINDKQIRVWDISNISEPVLQEEISLNCATPEMTSFSSDNFLVNICQNSNIELFDISDPFKPEQKADLKRRAYDAYIQDNLLLVAEYNGVSMFDLNDEMPGEIARLPAGQPISSMTRHGDYLYFRHPAGNQTLMDVAFPARPEKINHQTPETAKGKTYFQDDYMFRISGDSLRIFDVTVPEQPVYLGEYRANYLVWDIQLYKNFLYLSGYRNGLTILDISDPAYPVEKAGFPNIEVANIQIDAPYLYGENVSSFFIYNLFDPINPELESQFQPGWYINSFHVENNRAFLCVEESGLWILDISDPRQPEKLTSIPGRFTECDARSDLLYTLPDLKIFNISDLNDIKLIWESNFVDFWEGGQFLSVSNDYVFVGEENLGLFVYENRHAKKKLKKARLSYNYPNPFNGSTTIFYTLKADEYVKIDVYDIQGHRLQNLVNEFQTAGEHETSWNAMGSFGQPVASGVYMYRIMIGNQIESRKILLIR